MGMMGASTRATGLGQGPVIEPEEGDNFMGQGPAVVFDDSNMMSMDGLGQEVIESIDAVVQDDTGNILEGAVVSIINYQGIPAGPPTPAAILKALTDAVVASAPVGASGYARFKGITSPEGANLFLVAQAEGHNIGVQKLEPGKTAAFNLSPTKKAQESGNTLAYIVGAGIAIVLGYSFFIKK
jgi:hypothetical protein